MKYMRLPKRQGLYDPRFEHDSCGVGFVCNINGKKSHDIVKQGLEVLNRLAHRGATGADPKTGDGAGILIQFPHDFFVSICANEGIDLPEQGKYALGLVFLPQDDLDRKSCKEIFQKVISNENQLFLGWRSVSVNDQDIGQSAKDTQPVIEQIFIGCSKKINDCLSFERRLYVIRKQVENIIRASNIKHKTFFYIPSLSSRTFIYKGLLMPHQMENFFPDLNSQDVKSAIALVHSRYSTNTFPTWDLSQPFRFIAHNGEINTLRGNINWMRSRESLLKSELFGKDLKKILPVIVPNGSDSATIDNVFELLTLSGRSLVHAISMLIPAAWEKNNLLNHKVIDFHKYHSCLIEPWDGPAAIAFTDGKCIGAVLDRNGLRPCRYIVTKNDFVVMSSEVGVLDIPAEEILYSGRLEPGKTFFVDTNAGCIIEDSQIKKDLSEMNPYDEWIKKNIIELDNLDVTSQVIGKDNSTDTIALLKAFGYTREDLKTIIKPMAETAQEPVGSMGNDTPHAVLSDKPQLLFSYFKQLFAQVTNLAIDPIREEIVMNLSSFLGPEKNILSDGYDHCHKLLVNRPILTNSEIEKISRIEEKGFKTKTISLLFNVSKDIDLAKSIKKIFRQAESAIKEGYTFIILSDRGVNRSYASIPSLLAVSALHQYLVQCSLRTQISIILESAEPREINHFALVFGYGVDCVNPYLAFRVVEDLVNDRSLNLDIEKAILNYIKAIDKGILKVLSKMGISTLQSYRGAQIFEAIGLSQDLIDDYFSGTVSRIGGASLSVIAKETVMRHKEAFSQRVVRENCLNSGGIYQWKRDGEFHLWNPDSITALQDATRKNDPNRYQEFANLINDQSKHPTTLRGLLKFKTQKPIPINEVEPNKYTQSQKAKEILNNFHKYTNIFLKIMPLEYKRILEQERIAKKLGLGEDTDG